MKQIISIFCILLIFNAALFSQTAERLAEKPAAKKPEKHEIGFIFQIENIYRFVTNYSDGIISGFGLKYWFSSKLAFRGVTYFNIFTDAEDDVNNYYSFGLGGIAEYHFTSGKASPYLGGMGGFEILNQNEEFYLDYHIGGVLGVEIRTEAYLSFFAEYRLLIVFDEMGMTVDLGKQYLPVLGVTIYF
ncbi:MAG: hypothetical protein JW881_03220 [Spirochaetales bacterium]|nr:hypothetical protein [Spirochaetales bacterium]